MQCHFVKGDSVSRTVARLARFAVVREPLPDIFTQTAWIMNDGTNTSTVDIWHSWSPLKVQPTEGAQVRHMHLNRSTSIRSLGRVKVIDQGARTFSR